MPPAKNTIRLQSAPATQASPAAWRQIWVVLRQAGVTPQIFLLPMLLTFAAVGSETAMVSLLLPLLRGIVEPGFEIGTSIALAGGLSLPLPSFMRDSADRQRMVLIGAVFGFNALGSLFSYFGNKITFRAQQGVLIRIRARLFDKYLSFTKRFFDQGNPSEIHHTLQSGCAKVAGAVKEIRGLLNNALLIGAYAFVMVGISWELTLCGLAAFPLFRLASGWLERSVTVHAQREHQFVLKFNRRLSDLLRCIPLVKGYCMEEEEKRLFRQMSWDTSYRTMHIHNRRALQSMVIEILTALILVSMLVVMALLIGIGRLVPGSHFIVFFFLCRRVIGMLAGVSRAGVELADLRGPLDIIYEIFTSADQHVQKDGHVEFTGLVQSIEFRQVGFSYGERKVFDGLTLEIVKGKTTAFAGPSGGGKSTVLDLLLRYYDPDAGSIVCDGHDLRDLKVATYRKEIALVSQDVMLFNSTIRENLIYGLPAAPEDARLLEALRSAGLYGLVAELSAGLNAEIGDRGLRLSGGERQRLAIARALLKGSEILVLDEATSALDSKTENTIQQSIESLAGVRTLVVVAHRLATILSADRVYFIEAGKVQESGSPAELLAAKGKFFAYYEAQRLSVAA